MTITGGTPAGRKTIELTDAQMADIKALADAGPAPSYAAVLASQKRADRRNGVRSRADVYESYANAVKASVYDNDPRVIAEWKRANADLLRVKDIGPGAVHQNTTLSNLSVMYANEEYQGLNLMPVAPVPKETDLFRSYGQHDRISYPNDELGERGEANEINETRATTTYALVARGLSNYVSARTLANQDAPLDEMVDLVEAINEGLEFQCEQRIANVLTTAGNYGANTNALAAVNRWDSSGLGDPIANIQTAIEGLWNGRGPGERVCFSSLEVYHTLSRHAGILDLFKYNGSSPGLATPDMIAGFFMLARYYVCAARQNTANEAAAAVVTRVWGNDSFGIVRVARRASIRNASFGYTLRLNGDKLTQLQYNAMAGHGGGWKAQVSLMETQQIVASPTGWLITTVRG